MAQISVKDALWDALFGTFFRIEIFEIFLRKS
jgi:hypothetical protein